MCPQTRRGVGECHQASHQYSGRLQWRRANGSRPCAILAKQFPRRRVPYAGSFLLGEPLSHRPLFLFPTTRQSHREATLQHLCLYVFRSLPSLNTSETPLYTCCAPSVSPLNHLCSPGFRRGRLAVYAQADVYPLLFLFSQFFSLCARGVLLLCYCKINWQKKTIKVWVQNQFNLEFKKKKKEEASLPSSFLDHFLFQKGGWIIQRDFSTALEKKINTAVFENESWSFRVSAAPQKLRMMMNTHCPSQHALQFLLSKFLNYSLQ